jgi:hypothetical protein
MTDDEFPGHDHEPSLTDPRIPARIDEFRELILARYPEATFELKRGSEPPGMYLWTTVDIEDTGEVLAAIMDRLLEVQVEEYLPVYVIPVRPRAAADSNLARAGAAEAPAAQPVGAVS